MSSLSPNSSPIPLGAPSRLALFGGLLLAGVIAPPLVLVLGTAAGGVGVGGAIATGVLGILPSLLEVGKGWLVNKLAAEDGPSSSRIPPRTVAAVFSDMEAIEQAIGEAIHTLTEHVRVNPKFTPDEGTRKALETFGARAVENVKWIFRESPPRELEALNAASFPDLLGAGNTVEILDSTTATNLILEMESKTGIRLPEPARTELIRLCATRLPEALVGVFAHHLAEGDHSFAGLQLNAQAETLAIVQRLQRAAQTEFPELRDAIQAATQEITQTVRADGEQTRDLVKKGQENTQTELAEIKQLLLEKAYEEASAILRKVISQAEVLLKHHQSAEAAKLMANFSPHVTDRIDSPTRARFYGILGEVKLESEELEGALTSLNTSLAITYTSQAAVQYHHANLRLTRGSKVALDSLKEAVDKSPDDPSLASLFASTLSKKELQEFSRGVPASVSESPIFTINFAAAYSRNGDHDMAFKILERASLTLPKNLVASWRSNFQFTNLISELMEKNAARLLPNEESDFARQIEPILSYLESLPSDYDDALFTQQLNAAFEGRKYSKDREKIDAAILTVASGTQNQVARLYAARIALGRGDFKRALELISFAPSTFVRSQPVWYITALEAFGANEDLANLRTLKEETLCALTSTATPVDQELVIPLYQVLAASTAALGESPAEVANPEQFAELFPASASTIFALAYLANIPCRDLSSDEVAQKIESLVISREWGLVALWIDVLQKMGCTDELLSVARNFDRSVASEHVLKSLQVAFQTQNEEFALKTLQVLYEAGYRDIDLSCDFVHALYWHEPTRAMSIVRELVSLHPISLDVHLLLCRLAHFEHQPEAVCLPKPIPREWLDCNYDRRHEIICGLLIQDRTGEAEQLAFEMYLKKPNDVFAQKSILSLFLPLLYGEYRQISIPIDIQNVGEKCYVKCHNPFSRSEQDFWVATGHDEDIVQPKLTDEDPLYSQLMGKKVGESIVIDSFTTLQVREIKDWRLEIFHRAMKQLSSSVAHPKIMWQFSAASDDPSKEFDFTSFLKMIDTRRSHVHQVMSMARSQPLPAHSCASLLNVDMAASWIEVTQAGDVPRAMQENLNQERLIAITTVTSNTPLLLDETALLSIFLFGLETHLMAPSLRLEISSFARRSVAAWERNTSLFFAYVLFQQKTSPFNLRNPSDYRERLRNFRDFIDRREDVETVIFPGKSADYRHRMITALGRSTCQAMSAAARSGAALVCDDSSSKSLIRSEVGAECFSTFALVAALDVENDVWIDLCAQAIMVGYGGTPLDVAIALRLYERLGWVAEHGGDTLLLSSLKLWHRHDPGAYAQIALILESVFLRCGIPELRHRLAIRILNGVYDRIQDSEKIDRTHQALCLRARTGVNLLTTEDAAAVVDQWRRQW